MAKTVVLSGTASSQAIKLNWTDGGPQIIRYYIQQGPSWANVVSTTALNHTFTGLTNGTQYSYRIRSVFKSGPEKYSNTVALTPTAAPDPDPGTGDPVPSGIPMPTTSAYPWVRVFSDDFNTDVALGSWPTAVSNRWQSYMSGTSLGGYYDPLKVTSQSGGMLRNYLHNEDGQWKMTAPQPILNSSGLASGKYQIYGRYSYCWRAQSLQGYYMVPLLWPQTDKYLIEGEVDFPEGNLTSTNLYGFIHRTNATSGGDQYAYPTGVAAASGWHVSTIEWKPNSVKLLIDGRAIGEATSRTPTTLMRLVLQLTTSPAGLPQSGVAGYVDFDWVTVDRYAP